MGVRGTADPHHGTELLHLLTREEDPDDVPHGHITSLVSPTSLPHPGHLVWWGAHGSLGIFSHPQGDDGGLGRGSGAGEGGGQMQVGLGAQTPRFSGVCWVGRSRRVLGAWMIGFFGRGWDVRRGLEP